MREQVEVTVRQRTLAMRERDTRDGFPWYHREMPRPPIHRFYPEPRRPRLRPWVTVAALMVVGAIANATGFALGAYIARHGGW
jgi:hypothetical protein